MTDDRRSILHTLPAELRKPPFSGEVATRCAVDDVIMVSVKIRALYVGNYLYCVK